MIIEVHPEHESEVLECIVAMEEQDALIGFVKVLTACYGTEMRTELLQMVLDFSNRKLRLLEVGEE